MASTSVRPVGFGVDTEWVVSTFGERWRLWLTPEWEPSAAHGPSRVELVGGDNVVDTLLFQAFDDSGAVADDIAVTLLRLYDRLTNRGMLGSLDEPARPTYDPRGQLRGFERELADAIYDAVGLGRLHFERVSDGTWPFADRQDDAPVLGPQAVVEEVTTFVALRVVDQDGRPVPHAAYRVTLTDKSRRAGSLSGDGVVRIEGISPPGACLFVLPDFDSSDFSMPVARAGYRSRKSDEPVTSQTTGRVHRAERSDTLASIADQYGFSNYETIWNAPENGALRAARDDAHALQQGDEVAIPEKRERTHTVGTGTDATVTVFLPKVRVVLRLLAFDQSPVAGAHARIAAAGAPEELDSDENGTLDIPVAAGARSLTLDVNGNVQSLEVGGLSPIASSSGVRQRLASLGYDAGDDDDETDEALRCAIEEFECDHGARPKGIIDDAFLDSLRDAHGC